LERGVPQPGAGLKPGFGAPKSATLSTASSVGNSGDWGRGGGEMGGDLGGSEGGGEVGVGGGGGGSVSVSYGGSKMSSPEKPAASGDAALLRAKDAIRARASSGLSRLRRQRKIRRDGSAKRQAGGASDTTALENDPLMDGSSSAAAAPVAASTSSVVDVAASSSNEVGPGAGVGVSAGAGELPKPIFVLSDCTGESASNTCRAALGQFEECMDLRMPTNLYIFRFLSEGADVYKIVQQAAEDDALVVYTLSDASMATAVKTACKLYGVKSVNLWGPLLVGLAGMPPATFTHAIVSCVSRGTCDPQH